MCEQITVKVSSSKRPLPNENLKPLQRAKTTTTVEGDFLNSSSKWFGRRLKSIRRGFKSFRIGSTIFNLFRDLVLPRRTRGATKKRKFFLSCVDVSVSKSKNKI